MKTIVIQVETGESGIHLHSLAGEMQQQSANLQRFSNHSLAIIGESDVAEAEAGERVVHLHSNVSDNAAVCTFSASKSWWPLTSLY